MHEYEPISERDQLEYYTRVGGHLTRLALIQTLAEHPEIHDKSDVPVRNFLMFCELLRLGKDEEFLQSRRDGVVATSQGVKTIKTPLNEAGMGEAAHDMQVVNAMELHRNGTSVPPSKVGKAVIAIARDVVPFYIGRLEGNIDLALDSTNGRGVHLPNSINSFAHSSEFYIGQYYEEAHNPSL